ncbi:hypothetical protein CRUP_017172 [Coryphaenoides rupestris]|nr:hypothetical protein CRUP_017172 [Coryphaenoides rupestris]
MCAGAEVTLQCKASFPYLEEGSWAIWWTVDGRSLEPQTDTRYSQTDKFVKKKDGDLMVERGLVVKEVQKEDLRREFNCSAQNIKGNFTQRAHLHLEAYLPSLELGCGLSVTLVLMLLLFIVYHVFWLELLLLYRSWFGTDERYTAYLPSLELGCGLSVTLVLMLLLFIVYHVFWLELLLLYRSWFGTDERYTAITDETLSFVGRSRRLLVVLSPGFASRGSQALLELKAGMDHMALGGHLRVILVQYRPLRRQAWVGELRRARVALALLRWRGDESQELTSRFWKRLRLELPLRRAQSPGATDSQELGKSRTFQSQTSTSSQTGLLSPGGASVHRVQCSGGLL